MAKVPSIDFCTVNRPTQPRIEAYPPDHLPQPSILLRLLETWKRLTSEQICRGLNIETLPTELDAWRRIELVNFDGRYWSLNRDMAQYHYAARCWKFLNEQGRQYAKDRAKQAQSAA